MESNNTRGQQFGALTRLRFLLPAGAWALALLATAVPDFRVVVETHYFPFGVMVFLAWLLDFKLPLAVGLISIVGWLAYLVLTGSILLARSRTKYWVLYGLLCVLLILNVVGCHMLPPPGSNLM
jgi:hypothetical protein